MHFADLVRAARVKEHALGGRRLSGVDVGDNPDVSDVFEIHGEGLGLGFSRRPLRQGYGRQVGLGLGKKDASELDANAS